MKGCKLQVSELRPALLQCTAKVLIADAPPKSAYHRRMSDLTMSDSQVVEDKITIRWIQTFMINHDLVVRSQSGQLAVSPEKQLKIEKEVVFHLGELKRGLNPVS